MNNDILEQAIKAMLSAILDHQSDIGGDEDMHMMGDHDEHEDHDGLGVSVMGEDQDDLEDGLEEAMEYLDKNNINDIMKMAGKGDDDNYDYDEDEEEKKKKGRK